MGLLIDSLKMFDTHIHTKILLKSSDMNALCHQMLKGERMNEPHSTQNHI